MSVQLLPVSGLPEVRPGDDLAALVATRAELLDGDVVVVAHKVVSKAEGRLFAPRPGETPAAARRRVALAEAARVVVDAPQAVVVQTRHGFVCANGGVDASNVPDGLLVALPVDPDASARRLRAGLRRLCGVDVAVVVSDTFGRPWRLGQTDVAVGVAGIACTRDERGAPDRNGVVLEVTEAAVVDEVAAAADLVRAKADGVPVVVVRGLVYDRGSGAGARALVRPAQADLFPRGRGALADTLSAPPDAAPAEPAGQDDLRRALAAARRAGRGRAALVVLAGDSGPTRVAIVASDPADPHAPACCGAAAGVLVAAFADLGLVADYRLPRSGEAATLVVEAGRPAAESP